MRDAPAQRMPMTDDVRSILRTEIAGVLKGYAIVFVLCVLGIVAAATFMATWLGALASVVGLIVAILLGILSILYVVEILAMLSDVRSGYYLRDVGTVTADEEFDYYTYYVLNVNGKRLRSPWKRIGPVPFSSLRGATVDHTPRAHVVLMIRDADGESVYRRSGYAG